MPGRHRPVERDAADPFEPGVAETRCEVGAHVCRGRVVEPDAERRSEVDQNLPVRHGVTREGKGLRRTLQPSRRIRIGRFLLDERCARQHQIGRSREAGQEHPLNDQ